MALVAGPHWVQLAPGLYRLVGDALPATIRRAPSGYGWTAEVDGEGLPWHACLDDAMLAVGRRLARLSQLPANL